MHLCGTLNVEYHMTITSSHILSLRLCRKFRHSNYREMMFYIMINHEYEYSDVLP